jgi:hypothetical protein
MIYNADKDVILTKQQSEWDADDIMKQLAWGLGLSKKELLVRS